MICQNPMKNKRSSKSKSVDLHQKTCFVVKTCFDERSDFLSNYLSRLPINIILWIKKEHAFNANIKYSNGHNSLDKDLEWRILKDNEHLKIKTIYRRNFEQQDTNHLARNIFSFFLINLFVKIYIDKKFSRHLIYLERKD